MGHIRLGRLPKTKKWQQVVNHLSDASTGIEDLADKVVDASSIGIKKLKNESGLVLSYWLLSLLYNVPLMYTSAFLNIHANLYLMLSG